METHLDSKFYVPDISEFHVGFEYEIQSKSGIQIGYSKHSFTGYIGPIDLELKNNIRVKYLDKEDIESLGWKFIKQYPGTTNFYFEKETYKLDFDPEFGNKWNLRIYDGKDQDSEFNYFSGYIKNKSELKVLIKQLGVLNDDVI